MVAGNFKLKKGPLHAKSHVQRPVIAGPFGAALPAGLTHDAIGGTHVHSPLLVEMQLKTNRQFIG